MISTGTARKNSTNTDARPTGSPCVSTAGRRRARSPAPAPARSTPPPRSACPGCPAGRRSSTGSPSGTAPISRRSSWPLASSLRVDHPRHQQHDHDGDAVIDAVTYPGAWARERRKERMRRSSATVLRASAHHRATANRLPSQPNNSPSGSVRMTNPSAKIAPTTTAPRCSRSSPSSTAPPRRHRSPRRSWCSSSTRSAPSPAE